MTTLVETISTSFDDNAMLVLSNDPMTTVGTDFIFDFHKADSFAAAALPAQDATAFSLVNLARDTAPAIPRSASAVTAAQFDGAAPSTYDVTQGLMVLPSSVGPPAVLAKSGLLLQKGGIANNRVCEPLLEGFKSFLLICWFRLAANPAAACSPLLLGVSGGFNPNGGWTINPGQGLYEAVGNQNLGALTLNTLYQFGVHYAFDTTAGTSQITNFINGAQYSTYVGRTVANYAANVSNARTRIGGGQGFALPSGSVGRVLREFTSISGVDPLAYVAKDYALNSTRL